MHPRYPFETRLSRRGVLASLVVGAGAVSLGVRPSRRAMAAQSLDNPDGTAPIAAGSDLMPAVPVCWRLVTYMAKPKPQAPALARTLNFLMPSGGVSIHVANRSTGEGAFLVTHVLTAAFGAQDEIQHRYTDAAEPAPYVAWELIVADWAEEPATIGDATLLDLTEPFTAPQGRQAMELVALVVSDGGPAKEVPAMDEAYPLLGYVHGGAVRVTRPNGEQRLWATGSTHAVRPGKLVAYADQQPRANAFVVFPRFVAQRTY